MVGVEGPRAWWGEGLARHAGHTEAVLKQRQLLPRYHQGGEEEEKEEEEEEEEEEGTDKMAGGRYT